MKKYTFTLLAMLAVTTLSAQAALLTFDDAIFGATSYSFDGDGDFIDDVIFTTSDPLGFGTAGPGPNMTYINEPGLEGTSELPEDLRVDFLIGAEDSLGFGFALNSNTEDDTATFNVYDASDNLLATSSLVGQYTTTGMGQSNFPEGYISVTFAGTAAYATFNFTSDFGRYIIDNFEGTFGTTEVNPVPAPGAMILAGMGSMLVGWLRRRQSV